MSASRGELFHSLTINLCLSTTPGKRVLNNGHQMQVAIGSQKMTIPVCHYANHVIFYGDENRSESLT